MQTGTVLSRLALAVALIAGALPAQAQNATTPAAKLDIAGVRIGMTEAEAVKAVQALVARYGPYAARTPPVAGGRAVVHWSEDGKPQCSVDKDRKGQRIPWNNAMGTLLQPGAVKVLEQYARQRVPHLVEALGPNLDVARCGIVLRYEWNSEPVQNFEAWLVDQGGMIASNRKSAEWVEQLKAEAVRKLKGQGTAPKF